MARVLAARRRSTSGRRRAAGAALDLLLERCLTYLAAAFARLVAGGDPVEPLGLARLACAVGTTARTPTCSPRCSRCSTARGRGPAEPGPRFPFALRYLVPAIIVARTPDVPLPAAPDAAADAGRSRGLLKNLVLAAALA